MSFAHEMIQSHSQSLFRPSPVGAHPASIAPRGPWKNSMDEVTVTLHGGPTTMSLVGVPTTIHIVPQPTPQMHGPLRASVRVNVSITYEMHHDNVRIQWTEDALYETPYSPHFISPWTATSKRPYDPQRDGRYNKKNRQSPINIHNVVIHIYKVNIDNVSARFSLLADLLHKNTNWGTLDDTLSYIFLTMLERFVGAARVVDKMLREPMWGGNGRQLGHWARDHVVDTMGALKAIYFDRPDVVDVHRAQQLNTMLDILEQLYPQLSTDEQRYVVYIYLNKRITFEPQHAGAVTWTPGGTFQSTIRFCEILKTTNCVDTLKLQ